MLDMLTYYHFPVILASAIGELIIDFPDKVLCMCLFYAVLHFFPKKEGTFSIKKETAAGILLLLVCLLIPGSESNAAANNRFTSSYTQTVYNNSNGLIGGEANVLCQIFPVSKT